MMRFGLARRGAGTMAVVLGLLALFLFPGCNAPPGGQMPAAEAEGGPPAASTLAPQTGSVGTGSVGTGSVETGDGESIHYVRAGARQSLEQPALLFVPGWTMTTEIWTPQIEHFSGSHLVVAVDPRSQGRSSKARDGHTAAVRGRDLQAVVEALSLEPVVLVGWSMGVTEVIAYAEAAGTDGIAGLVLLDGVAGQDWTPDLALVFLRWMADFVHDREAATHEFVRGMYRRPHSEDYLDRITAEALLTPTDAAVALIVGAARNDFRHVLPGLHRPVLVAATTGSPWDPFYAEMVEQLPDARLVWFDGAGHALFVDDADRFNQLLAEFLAGLPTG